MNVTACDLFFVIFHIYFFLIYKLFLYIKLAYCDSVFFLKSIRFFRRIEDYALGEFANYDLLFYDRFYNWEIAMGGYLARNTSFSRNFLRGHLEIYIFPENILEIEIFRLTGHI